MSCPGSSTAQSGGRRLIETGVAALKSKNPNALRNWAEETFNHRVHRRLYVTTSNDGSGSNQCGSSDDVCYLKTDGTSANKINNKVKCFGSVGQVCRDSIDLTCDFTPETDASKCFGKVIKNNAARALSGGCCEDQCGNFFNDVKSAECSVDSNGKYIEKCVCEMSSLGDDDRGACKSTKHLTWNVKQSQYGETWCKWSASNDDACSASTCKEWATDCMKDFFCYPQAKILAQNELYSGIRLLLAIGSLVIIVGMLPICIGGTGKAMGNDDIGNICGGIGCCTSTFFTGCSGSIMIAVAFVVGSVLNEYCDAIEKISRDVSDTCTGEGLHECGTTLQNDVISLCAAGYGLLAWSIVQIIAQVFGLLAVVLSKFCCRC